MDVGGPKQGLNDDDDDNHVDEVRLRLWTAATNMPIVHPLGDMWAWKPKVGWKLLIRPPELSSNTTSRII
jgi:hypothetical protein